MALELAALQDHVGGLPHVPPEQYDPAVPIYQWFQGPLSG